MPRITFVEPLVETYASDELAVETAFTAAVPSDKFN